MLARGVTSAAAHSGCWVGQPHLRVRPAAVPYREEVGRFTEPAIDRSWMGLPLMLQGELTGILTVATREPSHYNERHGEIGSPSPIRADSILRRRSPGTPVFTRCPSAHRSSVVPRRSRATRGAARAWSRACRFSMARTPPGVHPRGARTAIGRWWRVCRSSTLVKLRT